MPPTTNLIRKSDLSTTFYSTFKKVVMDISNAKPVTLSIVLATFLITTDLYGQKDVFARAKEMKNPCEKYLIRVSDPETQKAAEDSISNKLKKELFNELRYQSLSSILSVGNSGAIGDYASLDTDENKIELGFLFGSKKKDYSDANNLWTLKVSGGNSSSVLPLLSSEAKAASLGTEVQWHTFLDRKGDIVELEAEKRTAFTNKIIDINDTYERKICELSQGKLTQSWEKSLKKKKRVLDSLFKRKDKNELELEKIKKELVNSGLDREGKEKLEKRNKSLELENWDLQLKISEISIESTQTQDSIKNVSEHFTAKLKVLLQQKEAALAKVEKPESKGSKIKWLTVQGGFENQNFKYFDNSIADAEKINDESVLTFNAGIFYNIYRDLRNKKPYFLSLGMKYINASNLDDLDEVTLIDRTFYDSLRFSDTETSVLTGDPVETGLSQLSFDVNWYKFFSSKKKFAYHAYATYLVSSDVSSAFNPGLGLFVSFKKKEDDKGASINAELFVESTDLFNQRGKDTQAFERTNIGIRTTIPLNF